MITDVISYFKDSLLFLIRNPKATKLMFANSFVGAFDILAGGNIVQDELSVIIGYCTLCGAFYDD